MNETSGLRVAGVLVRREIVRFTRQPARVAAAIGTPCLLWLLLASGLAEAIAPEAIGTARYSLFLLPGIMTLVAVFAAIFASITIIEDRREGWLQSVLVSPAPRWSIALGKVGGGALLAWAQAAILLPAAWVLGAQIGAMEVLVILAALALTALAMAAFGVAFAWQCETTASFHAVMNLLFMPLWLLSGAFFPIEGAAAWMRGLVAINPLTWCTLALREPLLTGAGGASWWPLALAALFAAATFALAVFTVSRPRRATW